MKDIPLSFGTYKRDVAKEPYIPLLNRFAENNPTLNDTPVSLISRPGLRKWTEVGTGHIRKLYSQPGTFGDDLFAVSGTNLFRVKADGTSSDLGKISNDTVSSPSMAATGAIGATQPYLFIADGGVLWVYMENGHALGHLEATGTLSDLPLVSIGSVYYQFTSGSVDSGTPDGTSGSPWLVKYTGLNGTSMEKLYYAIGNLGEAGVDYSTDLVAHPSVDPIAVNATDLYIQAKNPGVAGNTISTTSTGANLSWTDSTLYGGGDEQLRQVQVPNQLGAISVAFINGYVIVVPSQEVGYVGRFFWINPGELIIDPLNFATAERSPDAIHQVVVFGEMFWLLGQKTTEPWVTTGNPDFPMQRFSGVLYDRGSWEGTAVQVKNSLILVDENGAVVQIGEGQKTVSRPDIEERIRKAMARQAASLGV